MKTDRRHELQTNWLADHLGRWVEKIKPYTNHILTGGLLVVAGVVAWFAMGWIWKSDDEKAWRQFDENLRGVKLASLKLVEQTSAQVKFSALQKTRGNLVKPQGDDPDAEAKYNQAVAQIDESITTLRKELANKFAELENEHRREFFNLAKKNIGTVAGRASAMAAAMQDAADGKQTILTDPKGARDKLDQAKELFELLKKHAGKDRGLRHRAQFELAQVYETRMEKDPQDSTRDDRQQAIREYQELVKQDAYCKEQAQARLKALQDAKNPDYDLFMSEVQRQLPESGPQGAP